MQSLDDEKSLNDALLPGGQPCVHLSIFEGPLDLLLFLIRKNEVDIYDIPIETVTQQYLEILNGLEEMDLELTGDFFVMAATLMVIKSRMLLPTQAIPAEEEDQDFIEEDPRWELVTQLLQYKKIKEAASGLQELIANKQNLLPRYSLEECTPQQRPLKQSDSMELWSAFNQVLHKLSERLVTGEIHDENVTVAECMHSILTCMTQTPSFYFSTLIPEKTSINRLVATFLAILELCRLNKLHLEQTENFGDILCSLSL